MKILNTPIERFNNLPNYPFAPHYHEVAEGLQMHYIDEGDKNAPVVFLLHGEPSWSYLYRKMIPVFEKNGYRVIAPDLIGFGKSSKPSQTTDYTYAKHIAWTKVLIEHLDLTEATYFGQDWGGLIGLRLVTAMPERFARVVVGNTGLPTGDHTMPEAFLQWQVFSQKVPVFPFEKIIKSNTVNPLSAEELAAYSAPYPSDEYIAGARVFPALVPTSTNDPETENNRNAWKVLMQWNKPLLTLFSDNDPITKGGERVFQKLVPGAKGQPHQIIKGGGHFLQEDKGEEIANIMVKWMMETKS